MLQMIDKDTPFLGGHTDLCYLISLMKLILNELASSLVIPTLHDQWTRSKPPLLPYVVRKHDCHKTIACDHLCEKSSLSQKHCM